MSEQKVYAIPNVQTPNMPVIINPDVCIACYKCVQICPVDV
ncbi:MAG: 4Fe-4S binding protein, partial [Clostridiales bacterium]|nr:4Fe-4S binding protein [Clostridiales bacterium]